MTLGGRQLLKAVHRVCLRFGMKQLQVGLSHFMVEAYEGRHVSKRYSEGASVGKGTGKKGILFEDVALNDADAGFV